MLDTSQSYILLHCEDVGLPHTAYADVEGNDHVTPLFYIPIILASSFQCK